MSDTLLRSALWYLSRWGMNPVFCNIFKKPLHDWSHLYGAQVSGEDVVKLYRSIASSGGRSAGVALLPSSSSKIVVLDLDIYRVNFGMSGVDVAAMLADHGFIVSVTPRGGVRVVFEAKDEVPGRISISWYGKAIGEGGGRSKHMWHFPPSAACLETDDEGRCKRVVRYFFVLHGKKLSKYPWELPSSGRPPSWKWCEAVDLLKAILQVEISEESIQTMYGDLKPVDSTEDRIDVPVPCWRDLNEFVEWLNGLIEPQIPLPSCVARVLGYRVTEDLRNEYTGEKVPRGQRFTFGALGVMFLAATIARASVKELVDFVGQNLEDYPSDEGEPLNTKLSRLLVVAGNMVLPRYSGLGGIGIIPPELCASCHYFEACRRSSESKERKVPWKAFTYAYWENLTRDMMYELKKRNGLDDLSSTIL